MNRSSDAHTHCSKLAAMMALVLAAGLIHANEILTLEDKALIEHGKAIVEAAKKLEQPDLVQNPYMDQIKAEAMQFFQEQQATQPVLKEMMKRQIEKGMYTAHRTLVFASISLGKQGLDDVLSAVSGNPEAVIVFRGIPEGMNLGEGVKAIQSLAAKKDPVPNIIINPMLFKKYHVVSVPTIVMLENEALLGMEPNELARVEGLSDPSWLAREVQRGVLGDQKIRGPVEAIEEPDLIDVAKARFAKIDWDEKKKLAKERFWKKQQFNELPRANKSRDRVIDPSIVVTDDISAPDGTLIAKKGTVINPLDARDFTQAVLVFDPLDKKQMALLAKELPSIRKERGVQRIAYIATRFDRDNGWDTYKKITNTLDAPVYLLTPDLVNRFELEFTPSVITAEDKKFLVRELVEKHALNESGDHANCHD